MMICQHSLMTIFLTVNSVMVAWSCILATYESLGLFEWFVLVKSTSSLTSTGVLTVSLFRLLFTLGWNIRSHFQMIAFRHKLLANQSGQKVTIPNNDHLSSWTTGLQVQPRQQWAAERRPPNQLLMALNLTKALKRGRTFFTLTVFAGNAEILHIKIHTCFFPTR